MKKTIILIAGKKRSGKNYTAEMLQSMLLKKNISCETFSFAEPLKDIVAKTFLISQSELEDYKNNPNRYKIMYHINSQAAFCNILKHKNHSF
jgi:hypothetical protein